MTLSATDESRTAADTALNRLVGSGYRFVHPRDAEGNVIAVVGVRAHDTVIDVVRIEAEDDVTAIRMPGDEADILQPHDVLWQHSGAICEVVERILALGDDEHAGPKAGRTTGCWVSASSGRAKFLLAS